jgi:HK97 family phage portal protein
MLFKNLLRSKNELMTTDLTSPSGWFVNLFGSEAASGEQVTVESSLTVSTVYRCVNILANSVGMLPFQTFKKTSKGRERDSNHKVSYLISNRPNPYQNPFIFKHLIETHRNLWGNAYINIDWGWDGRPEALWLLNPSVTEAKVDIPTNTLWYKTTLPNGKQVILPDSDIIHVKTLSTDGLHGKPPIQLARESIGSTQAGQKFKGRFYKNGASPSGLLKVPGKINEDAKEVVRTEWEKANTGLSNAQRIAILDAGLEYQSIGMPLKDAQFVEGMKFDKAEVANFFNVPLHMVNELANSTYSNMEQQYMDFIQNTLGPIVVQYEQEFSYKLFSLPEQKRYYLKYNLEALLRGDSTARANFYSMLLDKGVFSINEVRELEEKDAIEGGDQHRVDLNHVSLEIADDYQLGRAGATSVEGGDTNDSEE